MAEYAFEGPKWAGTTISWSFEAYNYRSDSGTPFSHAISEAYKPAVLAAFQRWAAVAPLNFVQAADSPELGRPIDIRIGFGYLGTPGGGPVGLTSFGFSGASFRSDVVLRLEDPAELPLVGAGAGSYVWQGTDSTLLQVATHEVGHALGLDHSSDPQAVMYPVATPADTIIGIADAAGIQQLYGVRPGLGIAATDATLGVSAQLPGDPYAGPVAGLQYQYVNATSDSLTVRARLPNAFIHTGSGADAIDVSAVGGANVLDGGTGSNFLVGAGPGSQDTFFVDDRGAASDLWSTVANFHAGDVATIWGITPQAFALQWVDGQGSAGFTGLTLHATAAGRPTASITLAGYTTADLSNGRLSTWFGSGDGGSYLYVYGNA